MATRARRDDLLELPDELAEIKQRAIDALSGRNPSYSRECVAEVDHVLIRIAHEERFVTAPIATVEGGVQTARLPLPHLSRSGLTPTVMASQR